MGAEGEGVVDRAAAVFVQGGRFARRHGNAVVLHLIGRDRAGLEERQLFLEHRAIPGGAQVVADRVRQPEQVVGAARADPGARMRVPPVLHVSFDELPACRAEHVLATDCRRGVRQGHHVL